MAKLKEIKNFRETNHRCCANCKYIREEEGDMPPYSYFMYCARTAKDEDFAINDALRVVCDGFKWGIYE